MSSYVYRKAIRYKLPKDKVSEIDLSDYDYFDDSFKEIMNIPEKLDLLGPIMMNIAYIWIRLMKRFGMRYLEILQNLDI